MSYFYTHAFNDFNVKISSIMYKKPFLKHSNQLELFEVFTLIFGWHVNIPAAAFLQKELLFTIEKTGRYGIILEEFQVDRIIAFTPWLFQIFNLE